MNASFRQLLVAACCLQAALARSPEYEKVGVVALPLPPPKELVKVTDALLPYAKLQSRLVRAQIALWLQKLPVDDLQKLRASIPGGWVGLGTETGSAAFELGLEAAISEALSTHPDLQTSPDNPLTAIEAGRVDGSRDYRAALVIAAIIQDEKIRTQYLLGVAESAGRANSYGEAKKVRDAVLPLLPGDVRHNLTTYQREAWNYLWPAQSFVDWARTLPEEPEDVRLGPARYVLDHGAGFFATLEEATAFLPNYGRFARGAGSLVAEAMGKVLAARDPEAFMTWWLALPKDAQSRAIDDAIRPLLRRNPKLIDQVAAHMPKDLVWRNHHVMRAWFTNDPEGALRWCSRNLPDKAANPFWWSGGDPITKPMEPAVAVDLLNRFPDAKEKVSPSRYFDPHRHQPATFARELLRLANPDKRSLELFCFGMRWGRWDGPAAMAWAKEIRQNADRKTWVNAVLDRWMRKSPEEALRAAEGRPELTQADLADFKENVSRRLEYLARKKANPEPPRSARPRAGKTVTFPASGETSADAILKLRHSLAELTRPAAEPAVSNAAVAAEVLGLGQATVMALLENFEAIAPANAKENALRILLLERWALTVPEAAARWIIGKGNGTHRPVLPLALATLAPIDPELSMKLALQIPEDRPMQVAQHAILNAVALRSHRDACDLGTRYGCYIESIIKDWLRADAADAEAWLHSHLMEHWSY